MKQQQNQRNKSGYKKLFEEERLRNKMLYNALFRDQKTVMFMLDPESLKIVDANQAAVDFYGYPYEKLIQMTVFQVNPWLGKNSLKHYVSLSLDGKQNVFCVRHKLANNEIRDVEVRTVKMLYEGKSLLFVSVYDISPRIKAQKALEESEIKFRNIFLISPFAIAITHVKTGRYLEVNESFLKETGFSRNEIIGKTAKELGIWEDYNQRKNLQRELKEHGSVKDFPVKLRMKSGKIIQALVSSNLIEIEGEPYIVSISRNMEDYKKALDALLHSQLRYKTLFNLSPAGIVVIDEKGTLLDANPAFCRLLSYSPREIIGKKVWEALYPVADAERGEILNSIHNILQSDKPLQKEVVNYDKNGTPYTFHLHETSFELENGKKAILSISMDITREKTFLDELEHQAHRLKEAQEIGGLGSWELFWNERKLTWSEGLYNILELDTSVKPDYGLFQKLIHPDDLKTARQVLKDSIREGKSFKYIHRLRLKNGKIKWVIERGKTFRDDGGAIVRTHGTVQDITRLKEVEDQLKELNEKLEEKVRDRTAKLKKKQQDLSRLLNDMQQVQQKLRHSNEALQHLNHELEAFSYSVSHDLKAPLRAIRGFSAILKEDYYDKLDEKGQEVVNDIAKETRRMSEIIDALLLLSRTGRKNLNYVAFDPEPLVRSVFMEQQKHFNLPHARLEITAMPTVYADYSLVKQLVANLLSNALKYSSKEPEPVVEVGYETDKNGEETVFYVKDNGVGFDESTASKMFQAFQRLHSRKEFDGTGIGLAIAHRIVTRHGGKIWARGQKGAGAAFYFTLSQKTKTPAL